ncbi:MAG TPA: SIMPL domain-containing protein [Nocardioides sp.]|uniref:SIMPL domain-containing protein n=1 Tax=Nocardioides sp. TaxID=35761 RepID=UPI002C4B9A17|nr:SIMPL domain-containing protein [Nocardioides sp.]HQR26903.1 SIMPL domain-containing protein [Nocardioides sp.]
MRRTVTVTGQGTATVAPDTAVLRVAASHRGAEVAEACAGVASAVEEIIGVARGFTEPARIGTADFGVWPAHDQHGAPTGFEARHSLTVMVADVAAAGRLVSALAGAAGDRLRVEGISLEVADVRAAQTQAREEAFADARARAEHLAGLGGARLGDLVAVVEGGPGPGSPVRPLAAKAAEVSFEPGERAVPASLTVTWRLA